MEMTYSECVNVIVYLWMEKVLTFDEYNRIMDKLNDKHKGD